MYRTSPDAYSRPVACSHTIVMPADPDEEKKEKEEEKDKYTYSTDT